MAHSSHTDFWRLELKRAVTGLGLGLILVPVLVFAAGRLLLGPYEGSVGSFFGTFYLDLLHGSAGAIGLVTGPYALTALWRITRALAERAGR